MDGKNGGRGVEAMGWRAVADLTKWQAEFYHKLDWIWLIEKHCECSQWLGSRICLYNIAWNWISACAYWHNYTMAMCVVYVCLGIFDEIRLHGVQMRCVHGNTTICVRRTEETKRDGRHAILKQWKSGFDAIRPEVSAKTVCISHFTSKMREIR